MQTHGTDRRENCRELSWKGRMSMLAKYVLCILTIEWAVLRNAPFKRKKDVLMSGSGMMTGSGKKNSLSVFRE